TIADVRREGSAVLSSPDQPADQRAEIDVVTLREQTVGGVRQALWTLLAAVGAVLLVAVVNIALLLLTRGATRARELSVRMAIGASRGRLLRQLFVESTVLGVAGGLAGVAVAAVALRALLASAPAELPRAHEIGLDLPTLACAFALTVAASLGFGLLSAGRTLEIDLRAALGGGSRLGALSRGLSNRLHLLAAAELALTMVLLVVAGLLIRSFVRVATLDPGFSPRGVLAFQINLPANRYPDAVERVTLGETLLSRIRALGPVQRAAMTVALPNRQSGANFAFVAEGETFTFDPASMQTAETRTVSDGFFETMGMPLVAGRAFTVADDARTEDVCIVSEGVVRKYLRGRDPIGLRIVYPQGGGARIVGIVPDVRPATAGADPKLALYLPMRQKARMFDWQTSLHFVIRAERPTALVPDIRKLATALDPVMPVYNVRTLDAELATIVAAPRFNALVLSLFAFVALALACVGTYGVFAYVVSQRTLEIGIRTALGATAGQVLWLVMRRGGVVLMAGAATGLLASLAAGRLLASQLFELNPADPATLAGTTALLVGFGCLATWLPARRALRIKPLDALREM
ncbi:MAG TPA: FtsX-like permease family protein, partial [Vicinamibacterales bacterium]|nr:FtsX-like permease family protein [Vicinamibacterales bacterium]